MSGLFGSWPRESVKVGESRSDTCEMDVCQTQTTIRWKGRAKLAAANGRSQVIQTQKWVCLDDTRKLARAAVLALDIGLTPDGWLYIDSAALIAKRLDSQPEMD